MGGDFLCGEIIKKFCCKLNIVDKAKNENQRGDDFLLVNGFGDIYHETSIQNDKTVLPEKPFQAEKNIPKQEKVLGIGFLNAPAGNIRIW